MTLIYRVLDAGMVTMTELKSGTVSLADIVGMTHYLDMKADIEYANMMKHEKPSLRGGGRYGRP